MQKKKIISLKDFNSFGLDVSSTDFNIANSEQDIINFLKKINFESPIVLGGGTNMLFKTNIEKSILMIQIKGIKVLNESSEHIQISVGAGEVWNNLVDWCVNKNYGGFENLSLIPGNVGSAPIQNIGAYGVELKDTFVSCRAISTDTGSLKIFKNKECNFSYRSSIFKEDLKDKYIISSVTFKLTKKNHKLNYSYDPLKNHLIDNNIDHPSIKDISKSVKKIRSSRLPDPKIIGNCGSFFKNPIINKLEFEKVQEKAKNIPHYIISKNEIKIPAAWLIEKCGFKGILEGNTGTHDKHALIIINRGKASGNEIFNFSQKIKNTVLKKFNILLDEEVNIIEN